MKKQKHLFILVFAILISTLLHSQGYNIELTAKGFLQKNTYLGYYWGDEKVIIDTAKVSEKQIIFSGSKALDGGLYFIQIENSESFNFIANGETQNFIMKSKSANLQLSLKVTKSDENSAYVKYLKTQAKLKVKYLNNPTDFDFKIKEYGLSLAESEPNLFLSEYLKILYNPISIEEYFDSFDFSDERILKTDIYFPKIASYLELTEKTSQYDPAVLIEKISMILDRAAINTTTFKYTARFIFNRYQNAQNIATKKIYLYLAKSYFLNEKSVMEDEEELNRISETTDDYQFEVASYHNSKDLFVDYLLYFPDGKYRDDAKSSIEILDFEFAKQTHTQDSYSLYLSQYPHGVFMEEAKTSLEKLKYLAAINSYTIDAFSQYFDEYPNGANKLIVNSYIEDLSYSRAVNMSTISEFNSFLSDFPNTKYYDTVQASVEIISFHDAKRINTEEAYNLYLANFENPAYATEANKLINKLDQEPRRVELIEASKNSIEALEEFALKYPGTIEAKIAINSVNRYKTENNVLERKLYVAENFYWVADGTRDWSNDFYESSRDVISGGKKYNIFAFASIQNKTEESIKLKVQVNLNLVETSNLSIFYNVADIIKTKYYYLELPPKQEKALLVLFKDISEGSSYGSGWLSTGAKVQVNSVKPLDVIVSEVKGNLPQKKIDEQNKLISIVLKNKGNINISNTSKQDKLNGWFDDVFGVNSSDQAYLTIYFSKNNTSDELLKIFDKGGKLVKEDTYQTTGSKNKSYMLPANSSYVVQIPGYSSYNVNLRKGITHLIVETDGTFRINHEDEK